LLEFPLYRLRRRIDVVLLAGPAVLVIETKVGATEFASADRRQVEEYALDLRDFHSGSAGVSIVPILWCTSCSALPTLFRFGSEQVAPVHEIGEERLGEFLGSIANHLRGREIAAEPWDVAVYRPVPSVIEAATTIFAGHDVRSIANADASNLKDAAKRVIELIVEAQKTGTRLSGFP
jgi:hypothetical protein